ncbi:MAG TPA: hypothetical protein VGM77_07620 [Gemmatimonadales bacterium]
MIRRLLRRVAVLIPFACAGCSSDPGNDPGTVLTTPADLSNCTSANTVPITLAVGGSQVFDASQINCLALPGGTAAQEYVVEAYSGYGVSTENGSSAAYALQSVKDSTAPVAGATAESVRQLAAAWHLPGATATTVRAAGFDHHLRTLERGLIQNPLVRASHLMATPTAVPVLGDRDSFYVCSDANCDGFKRIGATVKYVGAPGIIYLDDQVDPKAEQLVAADFEQLGSIFDGYLYPTDTTAFGRESDINGDGHIAILMTPSVNALTPDCTDGRVIGYTFANDLLPYAPGSNAREMFYTYVPSVATAKCNVVTRADAIEGLQPTLIHELQHMISFNQHVLLLPGNDQDTWMNEGLSHFAEELGYRTVPTSQCTTFTGGDCFSVFAGGDIENAYSYLSDTESEYLIAPEAGDADLAQRGASWLFIRWVADHFASDTLLGTQFTRAMEQSTVLGAARVAQFTGVDFPTLVGEWHLATWTDDLPGFPQTGLLNYRTWDFRDLYAANYPDNFSRIYPLIPDLIGTGTYNHSGVLNAGSGRTVRFELPAGSPGYTIRMAGDVQGDALLPAILPYLAVVRVQ